VFWKIFFQGWSHVNPMESTRHNPVLFTEALDMLELVPGMTIVDATFGGGGHAEAILAAVGPSGRVIGIDRDQEALDLFRLHHEVPKNLDLVHANYSEIEEVLRTLGVTQVDGILADLGFSSDQIESDERGLSFLRTGPLDMRLDRSDGLQAATLVNTWSEIALRDLFQQSGGEVRASRIAKMIYERRQEKPFVTTTDLAESIETLYPGARRVTGIHPATKTFQALRMAVNQESEHLARFLESTVHILRSGGRLSIISFHSGEDILVKRFLQEEAVDCVCPREFPVCRCEKKARVKIASKKGIRPSKEEVQKNPRSRSAVLRGALRL
jgi:16S rRNA (cytosine1402-N4)-methyltransferase